MVSLPLIDTSNEGTVVNPTETVVLHSIPLSDFFALDYLVNVRKADVSEGRSFKMTVNKLSSGLTDEVYSIVGNVLGFSINAQVNGLNAELTLQNNSSSILNVNYRYSKT